MGSVDDIVCLIRKLLEIVDVVLQSMCVLYCADLVFSKLKAQVVMLAVPALGLRMVECSGVPGKESRWVGQVSEFGLGK